MTDIFSRNGTLGSLDNSLNKVNAPAGRDMPVGRLFLNYITSGIYSLVNDFVSSNKKEQDGERSGSFSNWMKTAWDKMSTWFGEGGEK